jgi:2-succinyl-5-enolpyruvyl-6-hydroxy-3-cyclohexene-1-carboxylate synthase
MSVPSPADVQATYAATLIDEWIRLGVRDAVVCPGSRSTPLALAVMDRTELTVSIRLDERSAGFFALGRSLVTGVPAVVIVTSGTAAAELHAAVAEADQAFAPLLVLTADRPPELHGIGAPQTMPQTDLYGPMVRLARDPGVPQWQTQDTWRLLARELFDAAAGRDGRRGPVHLNAAFAEPLVGAASVLPDPLDAPTPPRPARAATLPVHGRRALCVVGAGLPAGTLERARELGWVLIGDATSPGVVPYADGLLRHQGFAEAVRPDLVIRIGGIPASKVVAQRLREWQVPVWGVDLGHPVSDPDQIVTELFTGEILDTDSACQGDAHYADVWVRAAARAEDNFRGLGFADGLLTEAAIAREVVAHCNDTQRSLTIGSSMPIREVEWFAPPRRGRVYANRGVNGIDGVVSTAFGITRDDGGVALVGDLTFLHDVSALVDAPAAPIAVVVVANDGGHIFDFLPQRSTVATDTFRELFTTPRPLSPARVAEGFGLATAVVTTVGELRRALDDAAQRSTVTIIEARPSAPVSNVEFHAWMEKSLGRVADEVLAT